MYLLLLMSNHSLSGLCPWVGIYHSILCASGLPSVGPDARHVVVLCAIMRLKRVGRDTALSLIPGTLWLHSGRETGLPGLGAISQFLFQNEATTYPESTKV